MKQWFLKVIFAMGIFLFLTNLVGVFTSLRNPAIYTDNSELISSAITLSEDEFYEELDALSKIDTKLYVEAVTQLVHHGMAHYWPETDADIKKYRLRVPFYENYLLYLASYVKPDIYYRYEFTNHRRALERGVGLCSQLAIIETEFLRERDVNARLIYLQGHVVLQAEVEPTVWWVLDPDYGVVIPFSLSEIEANPEVVMPYYLAESYSDELASALVNYYGPEGNILFPEDGARSYSIPKIWWTEYFAYILIWVIPAILIFPLTISSLLNKRKAS